MRDLIPLGNSTDDINDCFELESVKIWFKTGGLSSSKANKIGIVYGIHSMHLLRM